MFAVVAADKNMAIGRGGELLYHIPEDMKHFKALTVGKAVIMGRKTLLSLPGGKPLPKRENYILSRNPSFIVDGATVLHSLEEAQRVIASYPPDGIACIGGADIYSLLLPFTDYVELTQIDAVAPDADAFFPFLDDGEWLIDDNIPYMDYKGLKYRFIRAERKRDRN